MKPIKLLADAQYTASNHREAALEHGALPVIPYPKNQSIDVKDILRVDRKFRSNRPRKFKSAFKKTGGCGASFQQTQELGRLKRTQSARFGQFNVSFSTLHSNHADYGSSRC